MVGWGAPEGMALLLVPLRKLFLQIPANERCLLEINYDLDLLRCLTCGRVYATRQEFEDDQLGLVASRVARCGWFDTFGRWSLGESAQIL